MRTSTRTVSVEKFLICYTTTIFAVFQFVYIVLIIKYKPSIGELHFIIERTMYNLTCHLFSAYVIFIFVFAASTSMIDFSFHRSGQCRSLIFHSFLALQFSKQTVQPRKRTDAHGTYTPPFFSSPIPPRLFPLFAFG